MATNVCVVKPLLTAKRKSNGNFFVEHLNSWIADTHKNWYTTNKNEFTVIYGLCQLLVSIDIGMPSDAIFSLDQRNLVSDEKISTPIFFLYDDKEV